MLKRAVDEYVKRGYVPVLGPELEFYLCEPDPSAEWGWRRYVDNPSHVYTVGAVADPRGVLREMLHACADLGLGAYAANHEFGRAQYEINLRHSDALSACDRAFLFKTTVKEMAARHGLLATFIGKPWNDDEGSGFHLHMSIGGHDGGNLLNDPDGDEGLSDLAHHFLAGILEHGPALMPFFNPTTNAYRRIHEEALVPTLVSWGHDNRLTLARVPARARRRHAGRAAARRRVVKPVPGVGRRPLRGPRRDRPRARAARADGRPDLRAARGRETAPRSRARSTPRSRRSMPTR